MLMSESARERATVANWPGVWGKKAVSTWCSSAERPASVGFSELAAASSTMRRITPSPLTPKAASASMFTPASASASVSAANRPGRLSIQTTNSVIGKATRSATCVGSGVPRVTSQAEARSSRPRLTTHSPQPEPPLMLSIIPVSPHRTGGSPQHPGSGHIDFPERSEDGVVS